MISLDIEQALINTGVFCMLTVPHEFAHAWVADKLGDDTPERQGRVTLYPPVHIDPMGTLILPFVSSVLTGMFFGWGKPVYTDPSKLRYGRWGSVLVALAGPFMNIAIAAVLVLIGTLSIGTFGQITDFFLMAANFSMYLALLNLLPFPPLDGSKLLIPLGLPISWYVEIARYGFLLLLLAFQFTGIGQWMSVASFETVQAMIHHSPRL